MSFFGNLNAAKRNRIFGRETDILAEEEEEATPAQPAPTVASASTEVVNEEIAWIKDYGLRISPAHSELELRPHQVYAVQLVKEHRRCILQWPTGSGKTIIILGIIHMIQTTKKDNEPRPILIVTRAGLTEQMYERIVLFLTNNSKKGREPGRTNRINKGVRIMDGKNSDKIKDTADIGGVVIVSRERMRTIAIPNLNSNKDENLNSEANRRLIHETAWGAVLFDEVHSDASVKSAPIITQLLSEHDRDQANRIFVGLTATVPPLGSRSTLIELFKTVYRMPMNHLIEQQDIRTPLYFRVKMTPEPEKWRPKPRSTNLDCIEPCRLEVLDLIVRYHQYCNHQIIVFAEHTNVLRALATIFRWPYIEGEINPKERTLLFTAFKKGLIDVLLLGKLGIEGVDLPGASVGINFESILKSDRAQIYPVQKLGRIMRTKGNAFFYDLLLHDRSEVDPDKDIFKMLTSEIGEDRIKDVESSEIVKALSDNTDFMENFYKSNTYVTKWHPKSDAAAQSPQLLRAMKAINWRILPRHLMKRTAWANEADEDDEDDVANEEEDKGPVVAGATRHVTIQQMLNTMYENKLQLVEYTKSCDVDLKGTMVSAGEMQTKAGQLKKAQDHMDKYILFLKEHKLKHESS